MMNFEKTFAQVLSTPVSVPTQTPTTQGPSSSPQKVSTGADKFTNTKDLDHHHQQYESNFNFGLRCGHSKMQVHNAITKLGLKCDTTSLLAELIRSNITLEDESLRGEVYYSDEEDELLCDTDNNLDTSQYPAPHQQEDLRPIIIDGCNIAFNHGVRRQFSCKGIQLAVDWFRDRGHRDITVFIPLWRKDSKKTAADQEVLQTLEEEGILRYTPPKCYDDRFMLNLAAKTGGIVVSNDNFRDLVREKPEFQTIVNERLLMYIFAKDFFMPPDDPLGRYGPSLDTFLSKSSKGKQRECPYGRRCTYGPKCKYSHPDKRPSEHVMVAEKLRKQTAAISPSSAPSAASTPVSAKPLVSTKPAISVKPATPVSVSVSKPVCMPISTSADACLPVSTSLPTTLPVPVKPVTAKPVAVCTSTQTQPVCASTQTQPAMPKPLKLLFPISSSCLPPVPKPGKPLGAVKPVFNVSLTTTTSSPVNVSSPPGPVPAITTTTTSQTTKSVTVIVPVSTTSSVPAPAIKSTKPTTRRPRRSNGCHPPVCFIPPPLPPPQMFAPHPYYHRQLLQPPPPAYVQCMPPPSMYYL